MHKRQIYKNVYIYTRTVSLFVCTYTNGFKNNNKSKYLCPKLKYREFRTFHLPPKPSIHPFLVGSCFFFPTKANKNPYFYFLFCISILHVYVCVTVLNAYTWDNPWFTFLQIKSDCRWYFSLNAIVLRITNVYVYNCH